MAEATEMPYFKLNTGFSIPAVGLGTWQSDPGVVGKAVETAIKVFSVYLSPYICVSVVLVSIYVDLITYELTVDTLFFFFNETRSKVIRASVTYVL